MGTQKELTKKQVELLMWVERIEQYNKEYLEDVQETTPLDEIFVSNGFVDSPEEFEEEMSPLVHYGYLEEDYGLTADGRQFIKLMKKYTGQPIGNIGYEPKKYTLIMNQKFYMPWDKSWDELKEAGKIFKGVAEAILMMDGLRHVFEHIIGR